MSESGSLDQRYLDFHSRTASVFERYPKLEALRYYIFRDLLTRRRRSSIREWAGYWLRGRRKATRTGGPYRECDVLIWTEGTRDTGPETLVPVYRELEARGVRAGFLSYRGPADLPGDSMRFEYSDRGGTPAWAEDAWEMLTDAARPLGEHGLRGQFRRACSRAEGLARGLDQALKAVRPRVVVLLSTQVAGGAAMAVTSRALGHTTVLLQHGIAQAFYLPVLSDYMATWGPSSTETLSNLGAPEQRLVTLGSPRHDAMMPSANGTARATLLEALSLPDRPTLVFCSNGNDPLRNGTGPQECAEWLERAAARYANRVNFIVRLHPNEDGTLYRNCPHLSVTKNELDLQTTLDGSDCVASLCSTVLYDALLYHKPVWQFYADGWPELATNWRSGLALRISSSADLCEIVERSLANLQPNATNGVSRDLADRVFANHGNAVRVVADFVQQRLDG